MHICRVEQVAVFPAPSLGRHKGELREVRINGVCGCVFDLISLPGTKGWKSLYGRELISQQVLASRVSDNSAGNHSLSQQQ